MNAANASRGSNLSRFFFPVIGTTFMAMLLERNDAQHDDEYG